MANGLQLLSQLTTGDGPPPVIILEGKMHISTWQSNDLPRDWVIALSEKVWTND